MFENNITKTALLFGNTYLQLAFTKYVSNKYTHFDISISQMWLLVMEHPLILSRFWVFSYIIDDHSCLNYCIFTKLLQIVYLINVHILLCQLAKYNCRLWKVLWFKLRSWKFSYIILHVWHVITSPSFYKLYIT